MTTATASDALAATPTPATQSPLPTMPGIPKSPIPVPTQADRAAAFPVLMSKHGHDAPHVTLVNLDRLESWNDDGRVGLAWELTSWTGGDVQRLWVRSSGEREGGKTRGDVELLYGHAKGAWWDVVGGIRQDFGLDKTDQTWAAIGIQGLAPFMFDISATAYLSTDGQTMLRAEAEYDLLLTNRLILQPVAGFRAFGRNDRSRMQGAGLSSIETGIRLRYRATRSVAPYLGYSYERSAGRTADYRRLAGRDVFEGRLVLGINSWF
ncbi:copper resistance protein B [Sphingomonas sp. 1185]